MGDNITKTVEPLKVKSDSLGRMNLVELGTFCAVYNATALLKVSKGYANIYDPTGALVNIIRIR